MLPRNEANMPITRAKENVIIEAASQTLQAVILAIAPDPPDVDLTPRQKPYNELWADKFPAIEDLHIITPVTPEYYLRNDFEIQARWPWCGFVFEEKMRNPEESGDEMYSAVLGVIVGTNQGKFSESQKEMHEIHHDIQTIIYEDQQLSKFKGWGIEHDDLQEPGGVVEAIRFHSFEDPVYLRPNEINPELRSPFMIIQFNYQMWYREQVIR